MEIERKFLIGGFPTALPLLEEAQVEQGYLAVHPVVRIRRKEKKGVVSYVLCFKGEGTLAREEIELPLDGPTFTRLSALLEAPFIRKAYKVYALPDGHRLEVSCVDDRFFYAEVEFASVEEANVFVPPDFLGRDITEVPGCSMGEYWVSRTFPFG